MCLYIRPHPSDLIAAPRDWKPALWAAGSALLISSSEEIDVESVDDVPSHLPQNEELVDVVTHAMAKLNINWPAECHVELQRGKLDEGFLRFKIPPPHRSLPFFPDLHTEVSRS